MLGSACLLDELARELAGGARRLQEVVLEQLQSGHDGPLRGLFDSGGEGPGLGSGSGRDRDLAGFAGALAQTIAYGLLTARWIAHGAGDGDGRIRFTPQAALEYLPLVSPALDRVFASALGAGSEQRPIGQGVDEIAALLDQVDMAALFPAADRAPDPIIHFYERFLAAYDPGLRNQRGVFYTPRPVVSYIVRGVHELLQVELGLEDGLAATDRWAEVCARVAGLAIPDGVDPRQPFVAIADLAMGTGTFLVECVAVIEKTMKERWCADLGIDDWRDREIRDRWARYVPEFLLPRLCGFELMMAPHAIAHLKLALELGDTGYQVTSADRLRLVLGDTLVRPPTIMMAGMMTGLTPGARKPFTVVLGNPPYAGLSANMSPYAQSLVEPYKRVDGQRLGERKHWLQDDYVKFVRVAQMTVQEAGAGVVGLIANHGFVKNPTFRGMRHSLLTTFDRLHVVDLHGNSNKKERAPDGSGDENVFDIRQGVAICFAARTPGGPGHASPQGSLPASPRTPGRVGHAELFGRRSSKYRWLDSHSFRTTEWRPIAPDSPFYLLAPHDVALRQEYRAGWSVDAIFPVHGAGFITARDHFVIDIDESALLERLAEFVDERIADETIRDKYFAGRGSRKYPRGDSRGWKVQEARRRMRDDPAWRSRTRDCLYRPLDVRRIYWADWMIDWPRPEVMRHVLADPARAGHGGAAAYAGNVALATSRTVEIGRFEHVWCSTLPMGHHSVTAKEVNHVFPLFLAPDGDGSSGATGESVGQSGRPLNLAPGFLDDLSRALSVHREPGELPRGVTAHQVFGYLYAVLHSPGFRARYADYLATAFPRIPLCGPALFAALATRGEALVTLHGASALSRPVAGGAREVSVTWVGDPGVPVDKVWFFDDAVWIDRSRTCGFQGIAEEVWGFTVGGYQVCRKWLKDRRGRQLSLADREHYATIVAVLGETLRLMSEIDRVIDGHGGWPEAFR